MKRRDFLKATVLSVVGLSTPLLYSAEMLSEPEPDRLTDWEQVRWCNVVNSAVSTGYIVDLDFFQMSNGDMEVTMKINLGGPPEDEVTDADKLREQLCHVLVHPKSKVNRVNITRVGKTNAFVYDVSIIISEAFVSVPLRGTLIYARHKGHWLRG